MNEKMKDIVEFESKALEHILSDNKNALNERQIYKRMRRYWNEDAPKQKKIINDQFAGPYGTVPFRLFYPYGSKEIDNNKCIIYIHGGGFTVGDIDTHKGIISHLANETNAVIAAIDYRLAPEFKFPVQVNECEAFAHFLYENAQHYHIDKEHISLAGDSAGGHLSLALAIKMRDEKSMMHIKSLILYYGSFGLKDSMTRRLYGGYWDGLSLKELIHYDEIYADPKDQNNPYRNLFNSDLTFGIPPAFILACELDPLADDSRLLYTILNEHGLKAKLEVIPGVIHGFLHYSKQLDQSLEAIKKSAEFYKYNSKKS